jgi:hypothetical protein
MDQEIISRTSIIDEESSEFDTGLQDDLSKSIKLGNQWFLNSGIHDIKEQNFTYGSMSAWYDTLRDAYSFIYQEIVGYGISTSCYLYNLYKNPAYLQKARAAASWLKNTRHSSGGYLSKYRRENKTFINTIYSFDTGMILNGLTNLYDADKDKEILDEAVSIGDWLISIQHPDGSLPAYYLIEVDKFISHGDKWSRQSGSFQCKAAIGLLHLHKITKEPKYRDAAIRLCDFALGFQKPDGRFVTDTTDNSTFVHPHCYTMEGLVAAGIYLHEQKYIDAVKSGLAWISAHQMPNGAFPYKYTVGFMPYESPDFSSQVFRIYLILERNHLMDKQHRFDKEKLVKNILTYQSKENNVRSRGGFYSGDGWFIEDTDPSNRRHINSWVSMFTLQTLELLSKKNQYFDVFQIV